MRDNRRGVSRGNKNVVKIAIFGLTHRRKHRITRKLLKIDKSVAMKQTLGRQVGEVREDECNMHVCVAVGSHWLKLLQTILLF